MPRVLKFEAGEREANAEPIEIRYKGEKFLTRSGSMPALPILRGIKAHLGGQLDNTAGGELVLEVFESVFDEETLTRLLRTGITMAELEQLMARLARMYAGVDSGESGEGESEPAETRALVERSSNGSTSSKRTSSASTGSRSGRRSPLA